MGGEALLPHYWASTYLGRCLGMDGGMYGIEEKGRETEKRAEQNHLSYVSDSSSTSTLTSISHWWHGITYAHRFLGF